MCIGKNEEDDVFMEDVEGENDGDDGSEGAYMEEDEVSKEEWDVLNNPSLCMYICTFLSVCVCVCVRECVSV